MKKVSIILAILILLTLISGCSKRTARDLATDTGTESETFEVSASTESADVKETDELKKTEREGKKTPKQSESTETKKEDDTTKPIETEKEEETKGTTVNPEPSGNTSPSPSGGNSTPSPGNTPGGNNTTKTPVTTKQPAETTSPKTPAPAVEPKPESDSKLPATVKVYSLNGVNVAVVNVKNEKGKDCSVEVKGTYKSADGKAIRTETKTFSGLSAGDDNNFIFNPGISFASFTCETKEISDGKPAYSGLLTFETTGKMSNAADMFSSVGGGFYFPDELETMNYLTSQIKYNYSGSKELWYIVDWVVFDNGGNAAYVGNSKGTVNEANGVITCTTDIKCEKSGDSHIIPNNFKGELNIIMSITYLSEDSFM